MIFFMTHIIKELLRKFKDTLDLSEELLNFKLNDELKDFTKYYSVKEDGEFPDPNYEEFLYEQNIYL